MDEPLVLLVEVENTTDEEWEYLQLCPERDFRFVVQEENGLSVPLTRWGQRRIVFMTPAVGARMGPHREIVTMGAYGKRQYRFPLCQFYDMSEPTGYRIVVQRVFPTRPFRENDRRDFHKVQHQLEFGDDISLCPDLLDRATSNEILLLYSDIDFHS
ncbi:MAG: hypothetical protein H7145_20465 [Akkermansiaceae bacterium]|nr:hypothetical protein [Armatimonadota bacterium]